MLMRPMCCGTLIWLAAVCLGVPSSAQERLDKRPQWRGPESSGFAHRGNPPTEWSEEKNVKWKVEIPGNGSSTPIVWGDKIIILTAIKTERTAQPAAPATVGKEIFLRGDANVDGIAEQH